MNRRVGPTPYGEWSSACASPGCIARIQFTQNDDEFAKKVFLASGWVEDTDGDFHCCSEHADREVVSENRAMRKFIDGSGWLAE